EPDKPDPRDARLGDTQPHGFDAVDEDEPEEDEDLPPEEAAPAGEEGDADDPDVLEDTPDFLQETPEHDRLWFEQKPPRDFDFDNCRWTPDRTGRGPASPAAASR